MAVANAGASGGLSQSQLKYLMNLYYNGTAGQKAWAKAELKKYGINPDTVPSGSVADPLAKGGILEMAIKTVILYGIFKVLMKVF